MSATGDSVSGCAARSIDHLTSSAVRVSPLENFRSGRSLNSYTVPPPLIDHDSASSGTISRSSFSETRPENISTTIPAEVVSVTRWGSRVGGSDQFRVNIPPVGIPSSPSPASDSDLVDVSGVGV